MSKQVIVTTAVELSAKQRTQIEADLAKKLGSIEVVSQVDPSVIGGIKIRVGSQEYDSTIKQKLQSLKAQLLAGW